MVSIYDLILSLSLETLSLRLLWQSWQLNILIKGRFAIIINYRTQEWPLHCGWQRKAVCTVDEGIFLSTDSFLYWQYIAIIMLFVSWAGYCLTVSEPSCIFASVDRPGIYSTSRSQRSVYTTRTCANRRSEQSDGLAGFCTTAMPSPIWTHTREPCPDRFAWIWNIWNELSAQ